MARIYRWSAETDGDLSEQALRRKLEGMGYDVQRYDYPPGLWFARHVHEVDKIDAVLSGRFRISFPEGTVVLAAGDAVEVPAGIPHSAEVVGEEKVVSLDAVRRKGSEAGTA